MGTFKYYRDSASPGVYEPPHRAPFTREVNIPGLIANGGLANTLDVRTALPATGFAANDILQVFQVSLGFCLRMAGVRVKTAEGAACTATMGCNSATQTHLLALDADGFITTINLNSATVQIATVAAAQLGVNTAAGAGNMGVVYVTNGSIDLTFGTADTNAAIFDVFAMGSMVF